MVWGGGGLGMLWSSDLLSVIRNLHSEALLQDNRVVVEELGDGILQPLRLFVGVIGHVGSRLWCW